MEDKSFPAKVAKLNAKIRSMKPGLANVKAALKMYEDLVRDVDKGNPGYTHGWGEIYKDHAADPSSLKSICIFLKCLKNQKVGIGHKKASDCSKTGAFLEPLLISYLAGISEDLTR